MELNAKTLLCTILRFVKLIMALFSKDKHHRKRDHKYRKATEKSREDLADFVKQTPDWYPPYFALGD